MEKGRKLETVIGFFVLIVSVFFFNYVYQKSGWDSSKGYVLSAVFEKADGLAEGVDVKISGVRVGKILETSVDPETFMANVKFYVSSEIKLPKDTSATIQSDGLLGAKYLSLSPGMDETPLNENDTIYNTSAGVDLNSLIGQFMFSKDREKKEEMTQPDDVVGDAPIHDILVPKQTKAEPIEVSKPQDEDMEEKSAEAIGIAKPKDENMEEKSAETIEIAKPQDENIEERSAEAEVDIDADSKKEEDLALPVAEGQGTASLQGQADSSSAGLPQSETPEPEGF